MRVEMSVHVPPVQVFTFTGICNLRIQAWLTDEFTHFIWCVDSPFDGVKKMLTTVGRFFIVLIDKRDHTNAAISRAVCDGRLHDKMGGTTIHANGQRVQRRSAWLC